MSRLGWFHLATAFASIASGALVFLYTKKGTRRHRQFGWVYVASMLSLNVSALMIYRLFGGFGPFHVFAIISLISIIMGTTAAIVARYSRLAKNKERRGRFVAIHYRSMAYSYVGLMAALVSESATRLPLARPAPGRERAFGIAVGIATLVVVTIGVWLIRRGTETSLQPFKATT